MPPKGWFEDKLNRIYNKGAVHWIIAAALIGSGLYIEHWLDERDTWINIRYSIYQFLYEHIGREIEPNKTLLVMIDNEEFWKGEPARRAPIKRTYLAKLLRKLDETGLPKVIALDFDMRSPTPDGSIIEHPEYQSETKELLCTVKSVSHNRIVVLPKAVMSFNQQDYFFESDTFDGFNFGKGNVKKGYIILHDDVRKVPLRLKMNDGNYIDSFAGSIVRAIDDEKMQKYDARGSTPCGSFIRKEKFKKISSREIITSYSPESLKSKLKSYGLNKDIFIIGGDWQEQAFGRGKRHDTYQSPVGLIGGVFIHANYVEALMDSRTCEPWGENVKLGLSIFLAIFIAVLFGLGQSFLRNLIIFFVLLIFVISGSYLSLHLLGMYFDIFIPIVLLFAHISIDKILDWYRCTRAYEELKANTKSRDIANERENKV